MAAVVPSLTYATSAEYTAYMQKLEAFATRVHVDVSDGVLTTARSISLPQAWWPKGVTADIHVMYQRPLEHTEQLVSMRPNLVIVHPEAQGDLRAFAEHLKQFTIKFGIAWMPDVPLAQLAPLLVFSGTLGSYGGHADPARFEDVHLLKRHYRSVEIGWDGGANESNVHAISHAGVDVINVGSGLSKSSDPNSAYVKLVAELEE
jgi:pentose-5-phosphate-3-epimerase